MKNWLRILSVALLAGALLGACSGDDGAAGAPGAPGAPGPAGPAGPAGPPGPAAGATVNLANLTAEEWAALTIIGQVTKATIASPTTVNFKLADAAGRPIVGIGKNTTTSSAGVVTYSNIRFELAKLVVGTNGSPDEWISYIVQANAGVPTRPTTDQNGKLVDNGDGTYVYTFARDIPKVKDQVAAATVPATSNKADLGDLTVDPNAQTSPDHPDQRLQQRRDACKRRQRRPRLHSGHRRDDSAGRPEEGPGRHQGLQRLPPGARLPRRRPRRRPVLHDVPHGAACVRTGQGRVHQPRIPGTDGNEERERHDGDHELLVLAEHIRSRRRGHWPLQRHDPQDPPGRDAGQAELQLRQRRVQQEGLLDAGQRPAHVHGLPRPGARDQGQPGVLRSEPQGVRCMPRRHQLGDGRRHDARWRHRRSHRSRPGGRLAVQSLPPGSHDQDRSPHAEPDEEQPGRHGRAGVVHVPDRLGYGQRGGDATIVFAFQQQTAPSTTKTFANLPLELPNFTGGPSFLLAYAVKRRTASPRRRTTTTSAAPSAAGAVVANLLSTTSRRIAGCRSLPRSPATSSPTIPACLPGRCDDALGLVAGILDAGAAPGCACARHAISVVKSVTGDAVRRKVVDATKCASCHEWFEGHGGNRVIGRETRQRRTGVRRSATFRVWRPAAAAFRTRAAARHSADRHAELRVDRRRQVHPA